MYGIFVQINYLALRIRSTCRFSRYTAAAFHVILPNAGHYSVHWHRLILSGTPSTDHVHIVCTYLQLHRPVQCDAAHQPLGAFQQGLHPAVLASLRVASRTRRVLPSPAGACLVGGVLCPPCVSRIHTDCIHPPSARSFGIPMLRLTCTSIQKIAAVRPICSLDEGIHRLYISFPALPASRFCWPALFVIIFVIQTTASRRPTPIAVLGLGALPPVISSLHASGLKHPSNNQRTRGASPCA